MRDGYHTTVQQCVLAVRYRMAGMAVAPVGGVGSAAARARLEGVRRKAGLE